MVQLSAMLCRKPVREKVSKQKSQKKSTRIVYPLLYTLAQLVKFGPVLTLNKMYMMHQCFVFQWHFAL